MQPYFKITADNKDITAAISSRLLSISISDSVGIDSDSLEITLDDRGGSIELPRKGALLNASLGYKETGLANMGAYTVDETVLSEPPATMTIRARSADLIESMKARRTQSWDNATLGAICATIAQRNGYSSRIAADLLNISIAHVDQVDESDMHFLTRLTKDKGAFAKPTGGALVIVRIGDSKSSTGKSLAIIQLSRAQIQRIEVTYADRGLYSSAQASYWDAAQAKEIPIIVGSGEPVLRLGKYSDAASAAAVAIAQLNAYARGLATLSLSCEGRTDIMSEARMNISGARKGISGEWLIQQVTHHFDGKGYHCEVSAESPRPGEVE